MSEVPLENSLARQLSTRWQVPLLLVSLGLLVVGIWRLRPRPPVPTFDQLFADVTALTQAGLYPEASKYAEELLAAPERTPEQQRRLHKALAEIIFLFEQDNTVHGTGNCEGIISHSYLSAADGKSFGAEMHRMRALAFEWLRKSQNAVTEYQQAVEAGVADPWSIRRRIIEIQRSESALSTDQLQKLFDEFLTGDKVSQELQFWAALQKVELYGRQGDQARAERFLADNAARFRDSAFAGHFDYLQALAWYHLGRLDDAERLLRSLRDRLSWADPTYVSAGWLLGKILQAQESPEYALSFYNDVLEKAPPGPYRTASILGRAESLAALERFRDSIDAYSDAIQKAANTPYGSVIDLRGIRESATARYRELVPLGRLGEAMSYLRLAARLVPPTDTDAQATYAQWQADLATKLGESLLADGDVTDLPDDRRRAVREYLEEAGREYLRLAKLVSLNESRYAQAMWRAADAFDRAGSLRQAAEVLDRFIAERPESNRIPEALWRAGQMYQAVGECDQAIARYQEDLARFPGTPSALSSLVPLADCFVEKGDLDKAEEALLRVVGYKSDESLRTIMPQAREYREALFRLGDLYIRVKKYEEAIARFQEVIERYPNDPRSGRATFMLAESYRLSAARLYKDYVDPKNLPYKDHLRATFVDRLKQARGLYEKLIERFRARNPSSLGESDRTYLKLSHFYRADAVYDLSKVADPTDQRPFIDSLEFYDRAAWLYQDDPAAMSAYIQMINCYVRLGRIDKARMTLQRARWALKGIKDEAFAGYAPEEDRAYWNDYLDWLEKTPTFAITMAGAR